MKCARREHNKSSLNKKHSKDRNKVWRNVPIWKLILVAFIHAWADQRCWLFQNVTVPNSHCCLCFMINLNPV